MDLGRIRSPVQCSLERFKQEVGGRSRVFRLGLGDVLMVESAREGATSAGLIRRAQGGVDDRPDGPGAAATIRAAPQAGINLSRRARAPRTGREASFDVAVRQDVAGADDHGMRSLEEFERARAIKNLPPSSAAANNAGHLAVACHTGSSGLPRSATPVRHRRCARRRSRDEAGRHTTGRGG